MLSLTKLLSFVWFIAPSPIDAHQNRQKRVRRKRTFVPSHLPAYLKRDLGLTQCSDRIQYMGETREP